MSPYLTDCAPAVISFSQKIHQLWTVLSFNISSGTCTHPKITVLPHTFIICPLTDNLLTICSSHLNLVKFELFGDSERWFYFPESNTE